MSTVLKYEQSMKETPRRSKPPWGLRVRGWEGSFEDEQRVGVETLTPSSTMRQSEDG